MSNCIKECRPKCDPCSKQQKIIYCGRNLSCIGVLKGQDLNRAIELIGDEICQLKQIPNGQIVRFLPNEDCEGDGFILEISDSITGEIISTNAFCTDGGASVDLMITVTHSDLLSLINDDLLVKGATYEILSVDPLLYGGTTIYVKALTENSLEPIGTGLFYNPKYNNSDDFLGIWTKYMYGELSNFSSFIPMGATITNNLGGKGIYVNNNIIEYVSGVWNGAINIVEDLTLTTADISINFTEPTINVGDTKIWGGKHWVNMSGSIGTSLDDYTLSGLDWNEVPYNNADYNEVFDEIRYDLLNDFITYRKDNLNNHVEGSYIIRSLFLENPIKCFQWGRDISLTNGGNIENKVNNASILNNINSFLSYTFNTLQHTAVIERNIGAKMATIHGNNITTSSISDNSLANSSSISQNTLFETDVSNNNVNSSVIGNNDFKDATIRGNESIMGTTIINNFIRDGSIIDNKAYSVLLTKNLLNTETGINSNTGRNISISNNNTNNSSYIRNNTGTDYNINTNTIKNASEISDNRFESGSVNNNELINVCLINDNSINSLLSNINNNKLSNYSDITSNSVTSNSSIVSNVLNSGSKIIENNLIDSFINTSSITNVSYIRENDLIFSLISKVNLDNLSSLLNFSLTNVKRLISLHLRDSFVDTTVVDFSASVHIFDENKTKSVGMYSGSNNLKLSYIDGIANQFVVTDINS